ncbi:uncharacterized protein LOC110185117 [Drosophila serrata]|nr:uncharacterized protein LOC110185117 [Drosophila serrata]KAH8356992.1 hypothetical protein KR200_011445 [Drosophila serrata]
MFRTLPLFKTAMKVDSAREETHANVLVFVVACALIRFIPIIVRKIAS